MARIMTLLSIACVSMALAQPVQVSLSFNSTTPLHTAGDARFLAYNIDIGSLYNHFDFSNAKLRTMVKALGPSVIRIGGTADDFGFYIPDSTDPQGPKAPAGNYTYISNTMWDGVLDFFRGMRNHVLLWDLDGFQFRTPTGAWDPSGNTTAFLAYTQHAKPSDVTIWWSIGNEPDLWPMNPKVSGTQLGKDAITLKQTLGGYDVGDTVYGPSYALLQNAVSTTGGESFINTTAGVVTGYTVHSYPLSGKCAYLNDFLDRSFVDSIRADVLRIAGLKAAAGPAASNLLLVMEETGGAAGGGCDNITNRFISGFWYMHMMGLLAESGFDRLHRQDIAGWSFTGGMSHYQLIGQPGWTNGSDLLTPHPDYFSSILFIQLIGGAVGGGDRPTSILSVSYTGSDPATVADISLHMWCASFLVGLPGSVTLQYINPTGNDIALALPAGFPATPRVEYILTSSASEYTSFRARTVPVQGADVPASIQDDAVFVNGVQLIVNEDGSLPTYPIPGNTVPSGGPGPSIPPYSYGFIAFPAVQVPACMQ